MAKKKKGYQSGRTVNPRAAAAAAKIRNAPKPKRRIRFEGPDWPRPRGGDRPPGGWVEGGTIESFNTQVNRKYGSGGSVKKKSDDGTTYARGSGAARPQIFRKNG